MAAAAISAIIRQLAADPRTRQLAVRTAKGGVRAIGRSRRRRANAGRYYVGKRLGIPPNRNRTSITTAPAAVGGRTYSSPASGIRLVCGNELASTIAPTDLVGNVYVDSFPINPAEEYTFPRLSQEGKLYQQYTLRSLSFTYKPQCASTQVGTLTIGFQADPTAALPTSVQEMMSLYGTSTNNCWTAQDIRVPAHAMARTLRAFYAEQPVTPDPAADDRTQTVGRLVIMTEGVAIGTIIGQLMVHYEFELADPRPAVDGATCAAWASFGTQQLDAPAFLSQDDETIHSGTQPLYVNPSAPHVWRKRTTHPVLLALRCNELVLGSRPVLHVNGAPASVVAPFHTSLDAAMLTLFYYLPAGRTSYQITTTPGGSLDGIRWLATATNHAMADPSLF